MDPPSTSNLSGEPQYVTVLPDYMDITMDYRTFHWGVIIIIILIILAIVILAIIGVSVTRDSAVIQQPEGTSASSSSSMTIDYTLIEQVFGLHDNPGASADSGIYRYAYNAEGVKSPEICTSVPYRKWNTNLNTCECKIDDKAFKILPEKPLNLPCRIASVVGTNPETGEGFAHSVNAMRVGKNINDINSWYFFQYSTNPIKPWDDWQIPPFCTIGIHSADPSYMQYRCWAIECYSHDINKPCKVVVWSPPKNN